MDLACFATQNAMREGFFLRKYVSLSPARLFFSQIYVILGVLHLGSAARRYNVTYSMPLLIKESE